jgi:hypothetical protein
MHCFEPPFYTIYWLLHVSAVVAIIREFLGSVCVTFQVTQTDPRSSLMMAGYCRNIWETVYRIKKYKTVHSVGYLYCV